MWVFCIGLKRRKVVNKSLLLFCFAHVLNLTMKKQVIEMNDFPALGVAAALDPEIGVDEQQRFDGKIFQLQIPDGMVSRDVSDAGQADAAAAGVGIVIVQVGHALFFVFL